MIEGKEEPSIWQNYVCGMARQIREKYKGRREIS